MQRIIAFRTPRRIVIGPGSVASIGEEVSQLKGSKVLVVTDRGVVRAGLLDSMGKSLDKAAFSWSMFDGAEPDPRYEIVDTCSEQIKKKSIDLIIGIGGGSSIDIAKTSAVVATNGGRTRDYFGPDLIKKQACQRL